MLRSRLAVVSLLLAACSRSPSYVKPTLHTLPPAAASPRDSAAGAAIGAAFVCDDSTTIYALFNHDSTGKGSVALAINDERLHLPQLVSGSGARYGDSATVFWNKGDSATFARGGRTAMCAAG